MPAKPAAVRRLQEKLNNRPRKILGYSIPQEVFDAECKSACSFLHLHCYSLECCFAEKICSRRNLQKLINACSAGSLKSG